MHQIIVIVKVLMSVTHPLLQTEIFDVSWQDHSAEARSLRDLSHLARTDRVIRPEAPTN